MKYLRLWLILATALGSVLAFACGGGSNNNGNTPGPTAFSTSGNGASNTPSGNGTSAGANQELKDLAGKFAGKETKVGYDFTSSAAGTSSTGSFTLFWKSKDAYRVDITDSGSTTSLITKDGKQYICDAGSQSCLASPVSSLPLPFLTFFTDPASLTSLIDTEISGVNFDKSTEQIAGQNATCYKTSGSVQGQEGSAEYCFNGDGLLVRLAGGSTGSTFTLEATSVGGSVSDADVALPYDIVQLPGQ